MKNWEMLKTVPRKQITGEMPLREITDTITWKNHIEGSKLETDQQTEVTKLIRRVAPEVGNVTSLREKLLTDPKGLKLETEEIKTLLALFINVSTASLYK